MWLIIQHILYIVQVSTSQDSLTANCVNNQVASDLDKTTTVIVITSFEICIARWTTIHKLTDD